MIDNKMIIYIGNKLLKVRKTKAVIDSLTDLLSNDFLIKSYSSFSNPVFRVFDGLYHLFKYKNKAEIVLLDVFSSKNFYYTYTLGVICKCLNLPYVLFLHGGNLPMRHQKSTRLVDNLFANSAAIVTPSGYLCDYFKNYYNGIQIIPNTINANTYKFVADREFNYPVILYLRGFGKVYNPQMLINALPNIIKHFPNTKAYLLGHDLDGTLNECKLLVQKLDLEQCVEFKGSMSTDEWLLLSNQCNIMVSTPEFDNTPISVLESMMIGLPVFSTYVGGIPYLIEDGFTGFLVEKNNSRDLEKKIINTFEHSYILQQVASNARVKVERDYTWDTVRSKWTNLFNKLIMR